MTGRRGIKVVMQPDASYEDIDVPTAVEAYRVAPESSDRHWETAHKVAKRAAWGIAEGFGLILYTIWPRQ